MDNHLRNRGPAPVEYLEFIICREMGWTFEELENQPSWRIQQIIMFMQREAFYQKTLQSGNQVQVHG